MKKGYAPILLIAIVAVSIIAGGILYWQFKSKLPHQPQPTNTPHSVSTPAQTVKSTPATDEITNWKTYTNNDWKFSLKYPQTWSEGPSDNTNPVDSQYPTLSIYFGPVLTKDHVGKTVSPYVISSVVLSVWDTKSESLSLKDAAGKFPYYCSGFFNNGILKKISGREVIVFKQTKCGLAGSDIAYIRDKKNFYQIINNVEEVNIDQILSTFKFTDTVAVFLKDTAAKTDADSIVTQVKNLKGVLDVKQTSPQEALTIWKERNKDEPRLLESVTADFFPYSLRITVESDSKDEIKNVLSTNKLIDRVL